MHGGAESARAFAVDDPNIANAARRAFVEIRGNEIAEIGGTKRMQVEFSRDRERHGRVSLGPSVHGIGGGFGCGGEATEVD